MKIVKELTTYHKYALESEFSSQLVDYCKILKSSFGWKEYQWDIEKRKWRFKDPEIIKLLKERFPELELEEGINSELNLHEEGQKKEILKDENANRIKEAEKSTIEIQNVKGELYEYQKIGIEFLVNSGGRALLADSPGVGKTAQALGYIAHQGFKRTLIVCPASVKFSWENEIEKWTHLKSFVIRPDTEISDIPHDANCIIINFDILRKFFNEFMKYGWNCLIGDEIHMIKSNTAIRTKAFKALSRNVPHVIMLTGTPVLSRPAEIFNVLTIIDPKTWNNYYSFAVKYCDGKQGYYGFEAKGASNLGELKERIGKYFLRRTKEEVLKQLPPKNRVEVPMELLAEDRKQYELVESNLVKYLKTYKKNKTDKEIAKSLQAEKLVKLNLLREVNTMGKIPTAKELIDNIIETGEKVLVFSGFNAPLKELYEEYSDSAVLLLGETDVEERGDIVKQFQENPNVKIFLGGTRSAGVGITLTAASNVIFLDYPWNPADLEQSENRAHRPGAEYESLNIYQITSKDSIDGFMKKLLQKKQRIIDQLIEDKEVVDEGAEIDKYIKELELKYKI